jgi:hypothetical protein
MKTFITQFPNGDLVRWKPLTWNEYRAVIAVSKDLTQNQIEGAGAWLMYEAAAALSVLDQEQDGNQVPYGELYAGTVFIIGQQVLQETGFLIDINLIKEHKARGRAQIIGDWYEEVKSLIMATFKIPEAEIGEWTLDKFMEYTARVETIIGNEIPVIDLQEEAMKRKPKVRMAEMYGHNVPLLTKDTLRDRSPIDIKENIKEIESDQPPNPRNIPSFGPRRRQAPLR